MKGINYEHLYEFLDNNSKYFTSVGFFVILLTLSLLIETEPGTDLNFYVRLLQSGSLVLVIFSLIPIFTKSISNKYKITRIFAIPFFAVLAGLSGYLWFEYQDVIILSLIIIFSVAGIFQLFKLKRNYFKSKSIKKFISYNKYSLLVTLLVPIIVIIQYIFPNLFEKPIFETVISMPLFSIIYGLFIGYVLTILSFMLLFLIRVFLKEHKKKV